MSSTLDSSEVEALMQALQEGRVPSGSGDGSKGPVIPYDLTSQDRIIRGQMPTLDSINDRIASLFGGSLAGRTRLDLRVTSAPATLLKFVDVGALLAPPSTVGVMALGPGSGLAVLILEGGLAPSLLAGALGDRKARPPVPPMDGRQELTNVERMVLQHLMGLLCESMATAWKDVLPFQPQMLRFESDPRMAMVAPPSEVAILCSFEIAGAINGRLQLALPYAAVEPAKKLLSSPPRLGGGVDVRFSSALGHELEKVTVELRVEVGRKTIPLADFLQLKVGDVVMLNSSEGASLPVFVQGRPKMTGTPRVVGGSLAVALDRGLRPDKEPPRARRSTQGVPTANQPVQR